MHIGRPTGPPRALDDEVWIHLPEWAGMTIGDDDIADGEIGVAVGGDEMGEGEIGAPQRAAYQAIVSKAKQTQALVLEAIAARDVRRGSSRKPAKKRRAASKPRCTSPSHPRSKSLPAATGGPRGSLSLVTINLNHLSPGP